MASSMNYGWAEVLTRVKPMQDRFSEIRFDRSLSEPHIYVAFYWQIDPRQYQKQSQDWLQFEKQGFKFLDQFDGYYLGKYRFGDLHADKPVTAPTLYVGRPDNIHSDLGEYFHLENAFKVAQKMP